MEIRCERERGVKHNSKVFVLKTPQGEQVWGKIKSSFFYYSLFEITFRQTPREGVTNRQLRI